MTEDELQKMAEICAACEVDYVKTSTGFNGPGATIQAVKSLKEVLPKNIKIKASGGIKDRAFAEALINAGASRLGCSASIQIVST